ncbi:MAG: substrate-binding domain-containing protein [Proteobacteria bacterium]|nr:substrate-binding domain-containing protein [Pseudomonadota bacterium]MBU1231273.1 substrate-binding domain-containing protein [Pseudomonadota bacterium]MBU1419269.1 substrate-binding domain-containing protein [Pseudomonadota bacterium]MBU1454804.1 substrate-binding domain-containing protein [Pseudomonadota bacterium]
MMKRVILAVSIILFCFTLPGLAASEDKVLKMSTTTSTQASGLLDILLPEFAKDTDILVKVIAKGTGAAIRDGIDGNVDIIFVHAKGREEKFVSDGFGTKRYPVMHNDFIILGPAADPAGIKGCTDAAEAMRKIASASAFFVSRGDDSGTHTKEQALWKASGLPLEQGSQTVINKGVEKQVNFERPAGDWYLSIGQGMGKALTLADEKQGYILADRGTYIKYKFGRDIPLGLEVLCEGDSALANPYGIIPVNPAKHPHVKNDLAVQFATWITSARGQKLIGDYRLLGQQLFYPDAIQ